MQRSNEPARVLTGEDIGVRIIGTSLSGAPIGEVVVRMDGQWAIAWAEEERKALENGRE